MASQMLLIRRRLARPLVRLRNKDAGIIGAHALPIHEVLVLRSENPSRPRGSLCAALV